MTEISNTIYVFKKVMKQMMAFKKHEIITQKNKEKIKKGVNVNERIKININDLQANQENKTVKTGKTGKTPRDTPWVCECGSELLLGGKALHQTRKIHFTNMKLKEGLQLCVIIPEPEIVLPEPEIVVPEPEIVLPEPEVVIPEPKKITKKVFKKVVKPTENLLPN